MIEAGKNFSVNTKKDETQSVIEWLNSQSNLSDSIRYLIEQDIRLYGVRNLQQIIPADRGYNFDKAVLAYNTAPTVEVKEKIEPEANEKTVVAKVDSKLDDKAEDNSNPNNSSSAQEKVYSKEEIDSWA